MEVEKEIQNLEFRIKNLKVQYDRFFSGGLEKQPIELREQIENTIRMYTRNPPKSLAHQFLLNTLISRFNSFSELWGRCLRMREMGIQPPHLSLGNRALPPSPPTGDSPSPPRNGNGNRPSGGSRIVDPEAQREEIQKLYDRYIHLYHQRQGEAPKVSFDAFAKSIERCTEEIKRKSGCQAVDFRVAIGDNDRIRIKAKPIRQ